MTQGLCNCEKSLRNSLWYVNKWYGWFNK